MFLISRVRCADMPAARQTIQKKHVFVFFLFAKSPTIDPQKKVRILNAKWETSCSSLTLSLELF